MISMEPRVAVYLVQPGRYAVVAFCEMLTTPNDEAVYVPQEDVEFADAETLRDAVLRGLARFSRLAESNAWRNVRVEQQAGIADSPVVYLARSERCDAILMRGSFNHSPRLLELSLSASPEKFEEFISEGLQAAALGHADSSGAWDKTVTIGEDEYRTSRLHALLDTLDTLGYYALAPKNDVPVIKRQSVECGDIFHEHTGRVFYVDSEDLEESGVVPYLHRINGYLARHGVYLGELKERFAPREYWIMAAGQWALIMPRAASEAADSEAVDMWELVTDRVVDVINGLLQSVGAVERLYYRYGGNDTMTVFLSENMQEAIDTSAAVSPNERVYRERRKYALYF